MVIPVSIEQSRLSVLPLSKPVVIVALFCLVIYLHSTIVGFVNSRVDEDQYPILLLPPSWAVNMLSLGYSRLGADLYWLSFVQYYGDPKAAKIDKYRQAAGFLDLITDVDPTFVQPYWFASFVLALDLSDSKSAERILLKGLRANPDKWNLPYIAGFNAYTVNGDSKKGAMFYTMASKVPGAPEFLARQAEMLMAGLPLIQKSARNWTTVYLHSKDSLVKERARKEAIKCWSEIYRKAISGETGQSVAKEQLARLGAYIDATGQVNIE